jgi:hypothetical protein
MKLNWSCYVERQIMTIILREENALAGPGLRVSNEAIALGHLKVRKRMHRSYWGI